MSTYQHIARRPPGAGTNCLCASSAKRYAWSRAPTTRDSTGHRRPRPYRRGSWLCSRRLPGTTDVTGTRRLRAEVRAEGYPVGRWRVRLVLAAHGLRAQQPRTFVPRTTDSDPAVRAAPNCLLGQSAPLTPNQVWVGDITYLPRQGGGWLYLATWLDRCSRKVVGWEVRESMPEDLVSEALRRALAVRQPTAGLVVHSDQGSQYSSTNFKALLSRHRALQSMSRHGNCCDNAHAESFWSRLKTELLDGGSFPGLAEAWLEISHYIAYYNAERHHPALGYHSPNRFETLLQTTSQFYPA